MVRLLTKLAPLLMVTAAAAVFIARAEQGGPFVARNLLPLIVVVALFTLALVRNGGRWLTPDRRLTLGAVGFSIPAFGLSLYLHASWFYDIDGIASTARTPDLLFRYLPYYTVLAGVIGFAIGWIVGKNVNGGGPPRRPGARQ